MKEFDLTHWLLAREVDCNTLSFASSNDNDPLVGKAWKMVEKIRQYFLKPKSKDISFSMHDDYCAEHDMFYENVMSGIKKKRRPNLRIVK